MTKCLRCRHWKPCYNGKKWDAAIGDACKYFALDAGDDEPGVWEFNDIPYLELQTIRCPFCHEEWCFDDPADVVAMSYKYCPNCGRRLKVPGKKLGVRKDDDE